MTVQTLLDLGQMPLVNNLAATATEALSCRRFPLRAVINEDLLVRLDTEVPPSEMFESYSYRSGINIPYVQHCREMWAHVVELGIHPARVIDIGGNDGTLLNAFRECANYPLDVINVDASATFRTANEANGIRYVNAFWGTVDPGRADLIVSTNVFQHNPNVDRFLSGIRSNLLPGGRWILEFPYFLRTAETLQFDQFYHEHYYYWLVTPLFNILQRHSLKIVSLSEHSIHGGTLRLVISHAAESCPEASELDSYLKKEAEFNFSNWYELVMKKVDADKHFIDSLRGVVVGFGAAAKACVYLNATHTHQRFSYIVDDTPAKQSRFVPGTSLQIFSRERLSTEQPDTLIILAHNFADYIATTLRPSFKGAIVSMFPEIKFH